MKTKENWVRARTHDVAYQFRMPAGIPGDVNRAFAAIVEAGLMDEADPMTQYGLALKLVNGKAQMFSGGETVKDMYGILVRPFPTNSSQDPLGTSTPPESGVIDILRSGYITVKLYGATDAAKGGRVFLRIANAGVGQIVGGFEAADDGANCIEVPAIFNGEQDASGNVEIQFAVGNQLLS